MISFTPKKILALTGTRADFGKLKPVLSLFEKDSAYRLHLFVTGMHLLTRYGYTFKEVKDAGYKHFYTHINQNKEDTMDAVLAKTINGLSDYVKEINPDLIVVHGDRVEALAGAIVGGLNNILVAHIEGGEVSGTIDESIRHAITKFAHIHFVSNDEALKRLRQLGERKDSLFVVGSPDIDVMLSNDLPSMGDVRRRYEIDFDKFSVLTYHPVTTEVDDVVEHAQALVRAVEQSDDNYIIILPNNDLGSEAIFDAYEKLRSFQRVKIFPSMRFEYFLTLLKNAQLVLGNSSAGVREAPIYGVPSVNIGTRQYRRSKEDSIVNCGNETEEILEAIRQAKTIVSAPSYLFGKGGTAQLIKAILDRPEIWDISRQKYFVDYEGE